MNINIRKINGNEYKLLNDFLYEAIFIFEGMGRPPREIINASELQVYVQDFGTQKDDICFVAEVEGKIAVSYTHLRAHETMDMWKMVFRPLPYLYIKNIADMVSEQQ